MVEVGDGYRDVAASYRDVARPERRHHPDCNTSRLMPASVDVDVDVM